MSSEINELIRGICAKACRSDVTWTSDLDSCSNGVVSQDLKDVVKALITSNSHQFDDPSFFFNLVQSQVQNLLLQKASRIFATRILDTPRGAEVGTPPWFDAHLTGTDRQGLNCLMHLCTHSSSKNSSDLISFISEKLTESGDLQRLRNQLTATNSDGWTCLMLCCSTSSSPAVIKLMFQKVVDAGGSELLRTQLDARATDKGSTCLMLCCSNPSSSSPAVTELIFTKIVELGGKDMLKSQLAATNIYGSTCLMLGCSNSSSSSEALNLILAKIVEAGGKHMLESQLAATDNNGWTCLMLACANSSSPEVLKLVIEKIVETGGRDLLMRQLRGTNHFGRSCLMIAADDSRGSSSPEVMKLLAVVLFKLDLFTREYAKLDSGAQEKLREMAGIDSSSWTPDSSETVRI